MNASAGVVDREVAVSPSQRTPRLDAKRLALYGAMGLGVLAVLAYGYHWVTVSRFIESTDDAYVGGDITVMAPKVAGDRKSVV